MAELVEEIANLLEKLKKENQENNEDLNNLLVDIRLKLENMSSDKDEFLSVVNGLGSVLNSKISEDENKMENLGNKLKNLEELLVKSSLSANVVGLHDEVRMLSSNIKEAVGSIVNFANKDSESKNTLFEKVLALETAVKNNDSSDALMQKVAELIGSFENFVTDAQLRHGNAISAMADLRHIIEELATKNTYLYDTLSRAVIESGTKVATLDGNVSAQLGTVNSKLFSLGDDIQKTLNDGFEHLKYLSANLSEYMNSNSIDMKTTLECLRANLSDYSEQLKSGLENFSTEFGQKIADSSNIQTTNAQSILNNINDLSSKLEENSKDYERYLEEGLSKVYQFLNVYRDAVLTLNDENKEMLLSKLTVFEDNLQKSYNEYKEIAESVRPKFEEAQALIAETADSIILGVINSNNDLINDLRSDLISSAGNNLEIIIGKISETTDDITGFKESIAENLSEYLSSIKELFVNYSNKVDSTMKDDEVLDRFTKLEDMISRADNERNENYNSLRSVLEEYKQSVEKFSDDIKHNSANNIADLADIKSCTQEILPKLEVLNNIESILSEKSAEYKNALKTETSELKASISEIIKAVKEMPDSDNTDLVVKLGEFETQLSDTSHVYVSNLESLKDALSEYIVNSEKNRTEVALKLDGAFGEVVKIQSNFDTISAKMSTLVGDSGLIEILANIRQQFNVVLSQLRSEKEELLSVLDEKLSDSVSGNLLETTNDTLNDGVSSISSNLYLIGQNLEEVRCKQSENAEYLRGNFEEKMLGLQADIEKTISEVKGFVDLRSVEFSDSLVQLKESIEKFVGFDYQQILADMKTQLEFSYVRISEDVKSIMENEITYEKIETLYEEAVQKLSSFEEYVKDFSESNFDLINQTLLHISSMTQNNYDIAENIQTILKNDLVRIENSIIENKVSIKSSLVDNLEAIKAVIDEKKNLEIEDFRSAILPLLDNEETLNIIKSLNGNLADRIEEFKQDHTLAAQDILDVANSVSNTVDYILDVINEKFENLSSVNVDLNKRLENINSRLSLLSEKDDAEVISESVNAVGDYVVSVRDIVLNLDSMVAEIHENTSSCNSIIPAIKMCVEKLKETISNAAENLNIGAGVEAGLKDINLKLEEIASDNNDDIITQILDIKNILNEANAKNEKNLELSDLLQTVDNKLDILANYDNSELLDEFKDVKDELAVLRATVDEGKQLEGLVKVIDNKLDILADNENLELFDELQEVKNEISFIFNTLEEHKKIKESINIIDRKLDILAAGDNSELSENVDVIRTRIDSLQKDIQSIEGKHSAIEGLTKTIDNKLDILAQSDSSELSENVDVIRTQMDSLQKDVQSIEGNHSVIEGLVKTIDNKLDILAQEDNSVVVESIEQVNEHIEHVNEYIENIHSDIKSVEGNHSKLEDLINTLHAKVDVLAGSDDNDVQEEISEIRSLIEEQIENGNSNDVTVKDSLQKLLSQISQIDLSKQAGEIKESVISAVVAVTNEISFVEETEEIKDFVNERTNELHRTMMDVKNQLSTLTCSSDDMDFYSYTLQDVESDIAKVRMILKDMSGESSANEICVMSNNILKISKSLENLKDAFIEAEAKRFQGSDFNEQLVSISSRLNQLLLSKKEVDDIILNHLVETRDSLHRIDNADITKEIEKILVSMDEKLAYSTNLNTILKNVMMYLGEWMDGTTETISSIYEKASKVNSVSAAMEELKRSVPDKRELIDIVEAKFNEQDAKISRLEEQLDRISGMLNSRDYAETLDRMDRIDGKLERLSGNIEKLAAYVE